MFCYCDPVPVGGGRIPATSLTPALIAAGSARFSTGDALGILPNQLQERFGRCDEIVDLYDQNRPALFGYLISLGLMPQESDDVIQETFLRLYRFLESGGKIHSPRSWLFRVGHNLAQNLRKRERRLVSHNSEPELLPTIERSATAPSPEDVYLNNEKFRRLEAAVGQLTEHQKACLQLRAEGLRYREIAEVLGITVSGVSETLKRAVLRLMSEL
jgi:RNA polymerase sigma-70 factor (ECF subfamily)